MKKILFISFFMLFFLHTGSQAAVRFVENDEAIRESTATKQTKTGYQKKKIQYQQKRYKNKQYEIEGYSGKKYVRFVVDVTKDKLVTGRMIEKKGPGRYVHGEFIDGVLHLYDKKGKHFTVILPE